MPLAARRRLEAVGPYTLAARRARLARPGRAGAVLHARGAGPDAAAADVALPRAAGRARVPGRPDRARAREALSALEPRRRARTSSARSATASGSTSSGRCSSAAGSGSRRCRTSPRRSAPAGRARLPQRRARRGGRARPERRGRDRPGPRHRRDPGGRDVLACGPEPMLEAVRALRPDAQLAWEAPMACGYGACYGCAVEIDGELKRLCVEGPVLRAAP